MAHNCPNASDATLKYVGNLTPGLRTSQRQISWSLEAAELDVIQIGSLWNLTGISAELLPRCLPKCRAIGKVYTRISQLRDFTRSCAKKIRPLSEQRPRITWINIKCACLWCTFSVYVHGYRKGTSSVNNCFILSIAAHIIVYKLMTNLTLCAKKRLFGCVR